MAVTYEQLTSFDFPASERVYEADETMLYALGVGLGHDPVDQKQLRFVTETKLRALPTMATVLVGYHGWTPQVGIDMTAVLHGEQRLRIERPLPPAGEVYDKRTLSGVVDKGPGGPVLLEVTQEIFARPSDERLATLTSVIFARGYGGFGGPTGSLAAPHPVPDDSPDAIVDLPSVPQAALLYRLNGDRNLLHSDPAFASQAGFDRPILHGLCTYGMAGHAVLRQFCDYEPERLVGLDVRFTAPVFPGETVRTEMWREGTVVSFRCRVPEREVTVIDHGKATLAG